MQDHPTLASKNKAPKLKIHETYIGEKESKTDGADSKEILYKYKECIQLHKTIL